MSLQFSTKYILGPLHNFGTFADIQVILVEIFFVCVWMFLLANAAKGHFSSLFDGFFFQIRMTQFS